MSFYGNAADFTDYHEMRGRDVPCSFDEEAINAALLVASEWLDGIYANLWIGTKTGGYEQEREWPRVNAVTNTFPQHVFPDNQIPSQVVHATYEAAFREKTKPGSLQVDFTPNKYKSASVSGAVSVEFNSSLTQSSDVQIQIPVIGTLMQNLIDPKSPASFSTLTGQVSRV